MKKPKIKPCPRCGDKPIIQEWSAIFAGMDTSRCVLYEPFGRVVCENCGLSSGSFRPEQEAIEAWNTRKGENQIENNIQAVAEVLGLNKGEDK